MKERVFGKKKLNSCRKQKKRDFGMQVRGTNDQNKLDFYPQHHGCCLRNNDLNKKN
jgi:hypothetical protein